jgi:hypothetical protein
VIYDPRRLELPRLVDLIVTAGGLTGVAVDAEGVGEARSQGARLKHHLGALNDALRGTTGGMLDLRMAVPGALAAASVTFFFTRARRLPEWYDLAIWAFTTFTTLHRSAEADEGADPA